MAMPSKSIELLTCLEQLVAMYVAFQGMTLVIQEGSYLLKLLSYRCYK